VLYSLHVCVWVHQIRQLHLTIPLFMSCVSGASYGGPRGGMGGGGVCPPLVTHNVQIWDNAPICFFGVFAILADFSIFSGFLN
jgi:hypothetical protein